MHKKHFNVRLIKTEIIKLLLGSLFYNIYTFNQQSNQLFSCQKHNWGLYINLYT